MKVKGVCSDVPIELRVPWDHWDPLNMGDFRPPFHSNDSRLDVTSRPA